MARRQQCEAALVSDCKQTAGSTHSQALLRTAWHFLDDQLHWSSRTKSPELPARRQDRDDPARETKVRADMTGPTRAKDPPAFPAKAAPSPARVPICPPLLLPSVFRFETESGYADQAGLKHVKLLLPRPVTAEDGCAHIWPGVLLSFRLCLLLVLLVHLFQDRIWFYSPSRPQTCSKIPASTS